MISLASPRHVTMLSIDLAIVFPVNRFQEDCHDALGAFSFEMSGPGKICFHDVLKVE